MQHRTPTDAQTMRKDLSLLLGVPLALGVALLVWLRPWATYEVPAESDIYAVVTGTWDWIGADSICVRDPHTISFSADRQVMVLTHRLAEPDSAGVEQQVFEYDIHEVSRRHVRGLIRGEDRLTESGEPVVWDLVLASRDVYRWHRTDWDEGSYTAAVRRCPVEP
jgi:hypothetical protein